jgi:hypothetical protein
LVHYFGSLAAVGVANVLEVAFVLGVAFVPVAVAEDLSFPCNI